MYYNEFDEEFTTDEEVEEYYDALLDCLTEQSEQEEPAALRVVDPTRMKSLMYTYKVLKYLLKGSGAKVICEINEPFKSMGSVTVIGKDIKFRKPEWFMMAVKVASNFNVYPKTDGTVQMDFGFNNLLINVE